MPPDTWQCARLSLPLRAPLHVGLRQVGTLQQTRRYVPARALRGAVTAQLTRALGSKDYIGVGRFLDEHLAYGYLFPAMDVAEPLAPGYCQGQLRYGPNGGLSEAAFDRLLIDSRGRAPITAETRTVADGLLHEVEFLLPGTRATADRPSQSVQLVGNLYWRESGPAFNLDSGWTVSIATDGDLPVIEVDTQRLPVVDLLGRVELGGELGDGFGRVGRPRLKATGVAAGSEPRPVVTLTGGQAVPAHLDATGTNATGVLEPLIGRETRQGSSGRAQFGQNVTRARVCWVPGSRLPDGPSHTLSIDVLGVLTAVGGQPGHP